MYLQRLQQELKSATQGCAPGTLAQGPAGKWNCGEILEHLYLTYHGTNKGISKCLSRGAPLATRSTAKQKLQTFVVLTLGYLPSGTEAPERARPSGKLEAVLDIIFPEIERMDTGLAECERRFGAKTKIFDHPIFGPLSAAQWRKFHWIHGRHHARQIRERITQVQQ